MPLHRGDDRLATARYSEIDHDPAVTVPTRMRAIPRPHPREQPTRQQVLRWRDRCCAYVQHLFAIVICTSPVRIHLAISKMWWRGGRQPCDASAEKQMV